MFTRIDTRDKSKDNDNIYKTSGRVTCLNDTIIILCIYPTNHKTNDMINKFKRKIEYKNELHMT